MKISIVLTVAIAFGLLRFLRVSLLMWAGAWWAGIYVLLRFGFTAPIPSSVITIYMGIVSIAILAYVSSSEQRREEVSGPLVRFMTEKRYTAAPCRDRRCRAGTRGGKRLCEDECSSRAAAVLADRASRVAGGHYGSRQEDRSRCRREPFPVISNRRIRQEFRTHVENGRKVYYQNCVFCHGDNMAGNGMFVHGLDPIPTNFPRHDRAASRDVSVVADLEGGPGLT